MSMSSVEFRNIVPVFSKVLYEERLSVDRVRQPGGGTTHTLEDAEGRLFYTLFYLKCYPTFDLAAFFYDVDSSQTCRWAHKFIPMLEKAL